MRKTSWRASCPAFFLFFCYTLLIWFCELADLLCWLAGAPQATLLSRGAVLLVTVLFCWKVVRPPEVKRQRPNGLFLVGALLLIGFFAVKAIRPDMSYDTQNYHLLSQLPGFADNRNYHVIPGRFQMYGFRLGDRLFYPFRLLLGLRMGTMLNAAAMVLIYRQLTVFLEEFSEGLAARNGQKQGFIRHLCPSLVAFFAACRFELIQESGGYMVELVAIPFFLEMVFLLLREVQEERVEREAVVFCLMGGLLFCLKMTNVVYLAPLVVLYLIRIRRFVRPQLFGLCLAAGLAPAAVYLIYNGITMKNPVYPYYNTLFHSPYYFDADFKDRRWGPATAVEILLWPWYMIRYPDYRLSELPSRFNLDLAACYAAAAGLLLAAGVRKLRGRRCTCQRELLMLLLYVSSFAAWTVTTGHIRYFMAGLVLGGLLTACICLRLLYTGAAFPLVTGLLLLLPFGARAGYGFYDVWQGREWALRDGNREVYRQNAHWVLKDRELFPEEIREKVDLLFLTWGDYGSYARLIGEQVPVVNRYSIVNELSAFRDQYLEQVENEMRAGKGVYDMFPQGAELLEEYLQWMQEAGYYVNDLYYLDGCLIGPQSYTMAGLSMADGRENRLYHAAFDDRWLGEALELTKKGETVNLKALVGDPDYWMIRFPFQILVTASDGETVKEAAVIPVGEEEYRREEITLDLSGLKDGPVELTFRSSQDGKRGILLNPEIKSW